MGLTTQTEMKTEQAEFRSTHDLYFLSCHWDNPINTEGWQQFKIGTCLGQWISTPTTYDILSVINHEPGNGHLDDVFEWFENSCRRDNRDLRILEIVNDRFLDHLLNKRGFLLYNPNNAIKLFRK